MSNELKKQQALRAFRTIPGVGKNIAQDFWNIGLRSLEDLRHANPDALYEKLCIYEGQHVDRCMLYVFRCAIYFVSENNHNPELLKWWSWKD